jgi:hypothetical protein
VPTAPNTPTYDGSQSSFSVSPSLPPGIDLDTQTGSITGTPTQASATTIHTVTASNSAGEHDRDRHDRRHDPVALRVRREPGRFDHHRLQGRRGDGPVARHRVPPDPGSQVGPERMAVHPDGHFGYVPNLNTNNMSVYTIDEAQGWLTAGRR